ncbi:MAG: DUF86 domain-containing protein [Proteobacteria bacterium]|nr:DUF86 domain-containing protein [Pseudomonadota bacterium]
MKLNQDLIRQKIGNIQNCLNSIKNYTNNLDSSSLADFKTQDAVVINLERAIQASIDIATHIISVNQLGSTNSMKDSFVLLAKNNIISNELSQKLIKMVGFRNIAVHAYDNLEMSILESILNNHLQDFENFYIEVLKNI